MKITARLTLGLAFACGMATTGMAHELESWPEIRRILEDHHCEDERGREDLLRGVQTRRTEAAADDQAARESLQDQLTARKNERTIERLEAENAKMRGVLTALGVDVDKALAAR